MSNNATSLDGGGIYCGYDVVPIFNRGRGILIVRNSRIANNIGRDGGGIFLMQLGAELTMIDSSISHNIATGPGGGVLVSVSVPATIVASTISGNWAGRGGGVFNHYGGLTLVNSTISGNFGSSSGGGISSLGWLDLFNTTVSDNDTSGRGGGISQSTDWSILINNTIVMGNYPDDFRAGSDPHFPAATVTINHSLIGGNAADVLFPLADNGGPTQTHKLRPER